MGLRVLTQTLLDFGQHLSVSAVALDIQNARQGGVFAAQTVQKVLSKDPANVAVNCFLNYLALNRHLAWSNTAQHASLEK